MMIETIKKCFRNDSVLYSRHAIFEMDNEEFDRILDVEVEQSIQNGEIIVLIPELFPHPIPTLFSV